MSREDTSTSVKGRFGPAEIICPYCGEEVHVEAGPTKLAEITHCNDRWIIVDLEAGKSGHTGRLATDGGVDGSELPRPKKYSVASGDPKCVRCGLSATKGYEGRTDFLDFCDGCFRMFERWLNGDEDETGDIEDTDRGCSEGEAR